MISKKELEEILLLIPQLNNLELKYGKLWEFIRENTPNSNTESENTRKSIMALNVDIDNKIRKFTKEQFEFLIKGKIYNFIGDSGNSTLNEVIARNSGNKNALIEELRKVENHIEDLKNNLIFLKEIFYLLPEMEELKEKIKEDTGIIEIHFQKECNVNGLKKLEEIAKKWNNLIKVLYELNDETPPPEIIFSNIEKGSLKVYIQLASTLLITLGTCTTWSLESLESYWRIEKLKKEVQILDMEIIEKENVIKSLEKQSELKRNKAIDEVFEKLIEKFRAEGKGILPEVEVKVKKQVLSELMFFLEKGGEISIKTNEETEKEREVSQLYKEINLQIENYQEQRYIEYKSQKEI